MGVVSFRKYVEGYTTEQVIHVEIHQGALYGIHTKNIYSTEGFNPSVLQTINKEETEKIIRSLIDYVRNGNKISEPELVNKKIVWMSDGRYAIEYDIRLRLADQEYSITDRIRACIYLDDSKAE